MNLLPSFQTSQRPWAVVLCSWCGEDLNANDNLGRVTQEYLEGTEAVTRNRMRRERPGAVSHRHDPEDR